MISIHAPRVGSDQAVAVSKMLRPNFNPRSPRGERRNAMGAVKNALDFNPRSPRGERLSLYETLFILVIFQSTLPAWGATS